MIIDLILNTFNESEIKNLIQMLDSKTAGER